LLILAARTGTPLQDAWWNDLAKRQDHRRLGAQDVGAIAAITRCARDGDCAFPPDAMLAMFQAALDAGGRRAEVMNIEADYALNVLHQPDTALYLWRRAIELNPGEPQYRVNRAKVSIALGRLADARKDIAALRRMNLPGTNEAAARALEARIAKRAAREQGD
jgi:tetratricopeptide (TPR) repeat protein